RLVRLESLRQSAHERLIVASCDPPVRDDQRARSPSIDERVVFRGFNMLDHAPCHLALAVRRAMNQTFIRQFQFMRAEKAPVLFAGILSANQAVAYQPAKAQTDEYSHPQIDSRIQKGRREIREAERPHIDSQHP